MIEYIIIFYKLLKFWIRNKINKPLFTLEKIPSIEDLNTSKNKFLYTINMIDNKLQSDKAYQECINQIQKAKGNFYLMTHSSNEGFDTSSIDVSYLLYLSILVKKYRQNPNINLTLNDDNYAHLLNTIVENNHRYIQYNHEESIDMLSTPEHIHIYYHLLNGVRLTWADEEKIKLKKKYGLLMKLSTVPKELLDTP